MADYIAEIRKLVGSKPIIMCGACVLILDEDGRILLHHRSDNGMWGLPGGAMELGEKLEETAAREVQEELGLKCGRLELMGVYSGQDLYYRYLDGNEVYNVTVAYLCREYTGELKVDEDEGYEAGFFDMLEIPKGISPPIRPVLMDLIERLK